jgi:glycerol-3-phosphate dehydrogenase subunit C
MAGTAGFKRRYFNSSMKIGNALFQRIKELDVQVVATDCAGCEMQMEHGSGVEVVHPLTILNQAYS